MPSRNAASKSRLHLEDIEAQPFGGVEFASSDERSGVVDGLHEA
jgi:hypothetical protein